MHRMPGRAASGGALAPEPAARHRVEPLAPRIARLPIVPFHNFNEIGRFRTSETSDLRSNFAKGRPNSKDVRSEIGHLKQ